MNDLPWAYLTHAYGSAEEVPMWLRQLTAQDNDIRRDALNSLGASLCHQGWICPATGYAVPFLIELAREPQTPGRDAILELLAEIAQADPLDEKPWRTNPHVRVWEVPPEILFKDAQAEVAAGRDLYIALLDDRSPEIRMQAAHVLVSLPNDPDHPETTEELRDLLRARFSEEQDERVRANLVAAVGRVDWLQVADEIRWFRSLLASQMGALVRFRAALRLAELQKEAAPRAALTILIQALKQQPETLRPAARVALYEFGPERLFTLVPWLKETIAHPTDPWGYVESLYADLLLFIVFYGRPREPAQPRSATRLTTEQTNTLKHLLTCAEVWRHSNFTNLLGAYGLPHEREKLAAYLGEAIPEAPAPPRSQAFRDPHGERLRVYRAVLQEHYPQISVRVLNGAWRSGGEDTLDDDVFTVNSEFVFRFPRRPDTLAAVAREARLLRALQGRLPLPVPDPAYSHIDTLEVGQAFMGCALFKGKPLHKEMLESLPGEAAAGVADALGAFMRALHAVPLAELEALDLPMPHTQEKWEARIARVRERYAPRLPEPRRKLADQILTLYESDPHFLDFTPALIHGALEPQTIIYDARAQAISGIIGFNHAGIGDPAYDLACLLGSRGYGAEFAKRFIPEYPALAGMFKRVAFYVWMRFFESRMEPGHERLPGHGVYFPLT